MEAPVKAQVWIITPVCAPWDFTENIVNYKLKPAQICHARMVQTVLIHLMVMNANVLTDSQVIKTLFIFKKCQNCLFFAFFSIVSS
jgi:hypothetical protein